VWLWKSIVFLQAGVDLEHNPKVGHQRESHLWHVVIVGVRRIDERLQSRMRSSGV